MVRLTRFAWDGFLFPLAGADNDSLHTMLSMDGDIAFTSFKNTSDSIAEVTFNIKDFRAMLSLCEALSCDIRIFFLNPGHPLVVEAYFNVDQGSVRVIDGPQPEQCSFYFMCPFQNFVCCTTFFCSSFVSNLVIFFSSLRLSGLILFYLLYPEILNPRRWKQTWTVRGTILV